MKAYKFLEEGYKAMHNDFRYEIGQTYVHSGDIKLCEAGFHASKEIRDAIQCCIGSHLVEVELGGNIIEGEDKVVASKITILRELDIVKELETLAGDKDWRVRCAVAYNPNTPIKILETLVGDEHCRVRSYVAQNLNVRSRRTRRAIAKNSDTPVKILETLAMDISGVVREAVAMNPNTPIKILETLAGDGDEWVRCAVAYNPNTPIKILETLAGDEDWKVSYIASYTPRMIKVKFEHVLVNYLYRLINFIMRKEG